MKILAVAFAYNEMRLLPAMVNFYRTQGCDVFILDNASNDGTQAWLAKHEVATQVLSTGGLFHLIKLQRGLLSYIHDVRPDWVVYTGIDIIYAFAGSIRHTIERADNAGYNLLGVQHFNAYNTGEAYKLPLHQHFFYARKGNFLFMIAKYVPGVLVNYGNCKPKHEREETYRRRKAAWEAGLDRNYGVHYIEGHKRGWIWPKAELTDMRTTQYWQFIKNVKL